MAARSLRRSDMKDILLVAAVAETVVVFLIFAMAVSLYVAAW